MKFKILPLLILIQSFGYSQSVADVDRVIDSTTFVIKYHEEKLEELKSQLKFLEKFRAELYMKEVEGNVMVCNLGTLVRDKPNGDKVTQLKNGDKVILLRGEGEWSEVDFNGIKGYVPSNAIVTQQEMAEIIVGKAQKQLERENAMKIRYQDLSLKYGETNALKIMANSYEVGWNKNMIRESIGEPNKINRTVNQFGVSEQWIYVDRNLYLYFDDNKLDNP